MFPSSAGTCRPPLAPIGTLLLALLLIGCSQTEGPGDLPAAVDFNEHVRPILSEHCYACHGPDAGSREAGLRLDTPDGATALLESGVHAIVPGDPAASALLRRVSSPDPEERMPPRSANKTLSERQVALLRRWIEQGAAWKPHWAFVPPTPVSIPDSYADRPVDFFLDARLREAGLDAAGPASPHALIRRLYFVLTGLPPAPEEVSAFVEDYSPEAYERLVDRLLASPQYGERWARHWMDLVRYAEGKGHEFDFTIGGAWRYRDYLIRAFNADVPYDQFVREHLAGDLLPIPRRHPSVGYNESAYGTAFYLFGEGKHSPVDVRQEEVDAIDNIIDVTTKTFLGLTVACARCHDHKFDPIPTADYYALFGVFESTRMAPIPAHRTLAQSAAVDSLATLQDAMRRRLAAHWMNELELDSSPFHLTGSGRPSTVARVAAPVEKPRVSPDSLGPRVLGDFRDGDFDGWFVDGPAFGDRPLLGEPVFDPASGSIRELASPLASSRRFSTRLHGALRSPTFTIDVDYVDVSARGRRGTARIVIDNFHLIRAPIYGGLEKTVDSLALATYRFDVSKWKGHKAYVELLGFPHTHFQPAADSASFIEVAYVAAHDGVLPLSTSPPHASSAFRSEALLRQALLAWGQGRVSPSQVEGLNRLLGNVLDPSRAPVADLLQAYERIARSTVDTAYFSGVVDGDGLESPVFERGNYQSSDGPRVPHRFLSVLDSSRTPFPPGGSGRLALAEAVVDPANPLTSRVMVNRLWHHVFGRGLVPTVDNFGAQGTPPSHPALLDYLAVRFVASGWSIKSTLRTLVLSEAFRRTTTASREASARDPENMLLQHYPVRRLDAEAIRDAVLSVSGRLDPGLYGPPVPTHLTEFMTGRGRPSVSGPLDGAGRRSIYLSVRRNFLSPFLLVFDMPIPFSTFGRRNVTNVPAQSLTLLNDPFVLDQARFLALRLAAMPGLDAERKIRMLYLAAFARPPSPLEVEEGLAFLERRAREAEALHDRAGSSVSPWTDYVHALFNMKEFIFLL